MSPAPTEEWKRHHLWFPDGNILISAVSVPGTGRGRWDIDENAKCEDERILRNMFDLPEARGDTLDPSDVHKLDGDDKDFATLSLAELQDSSEEVAAFLDAIYNPWDLPLVRHDDQTVYKVLPIMRMADKYQCASLRSHIIDHLNADWPDDGNAWIEFDTIKASRRRSHVGDQSFRRILPDPAANLRFVLEFGKEDMERSLPAILYDLSRRKTYLDYDSPGHFDRKNDNVARWDLLDGHDLMTVLFLKETISEFAFCYMNSLTHGPSENCLAVKEDKEKFFLMWDSIRHDIGEEGDVLRVISDWKGRLSSLDFNDSRVSKPCQNCSLELYDDFTRVSHGIWELAESSAHKYTCSGRFR